MMKLYIEDDAGNVRVVPIEGPRITIGRAEDNSVVIPERNISRHHAAVDLSNGGIRLEEVKARYGIRINGVFIPGSANLNPGDFFQIGDYQFKILARDAAISEASDEVDHGTTRRTTTRARPVGSTESNTPTRSLMELQDIEAVARMGWRSDFFDEEVASSGRGLVARLVLLMVLVLIAAGLAFAYYKLYVEEPYTNLARSPVPVQTHAAPDKAPEPEPTPAPEPAPAPDPAPAAEEPAPGDAPKVVPDEERAPVKSRLAARAQEPSHTTTRPAPKPLVVAKAAAETAADAPRPVPAAVAPAPAPAPSKPAPNPVKAAPSPPPAAAAGDSEALLEEIDQAIAQGDLDRAVSLLAKCRGSGCLRRQKQIGYRYQGLGSTDKAIDAWKRAYRMTRDPREQESIRRIVRDLGGSVD